MKHFVYFILALAMAIGIVLETVFNIGTMSLNMMAVNTIALIGSFIMMIIFSDFSMDEVDDVFEE